MGKATLRMGRTGKGQAAKIGMNLMIATMYEGFAEALVLTSKLGVESENMLQLIQSSMVRSGVVDYKAPFVLKRDFTPNFPLRLMHKDLKLMLDAARERRVKLPELGDRRRGLRHRGRRGIRRSRFTPRPLNCWRSGLAWKSRATADRPLPQHSFVPF